MYALHELEACFARAILHNDMAALADVIEADGLEVAARLGIHRNTTLASLTDVLMATFPVVRRLVDDRFFAYAADAFISSTPPRSACLDEFGVEFPAFIAGFPACAGLPYLAAVAQLEWHLHTAARAVVITPLPAEVLTVVAPERTVDLILDFDPARAYLAASWPLSRIWRANQPEVTEAAVIDLDAGAENLEIVRGGDFRLIDAAVFNFRAELATGKPLLIAAEAALTVDPEFDLTAALANLFADGAIVGWRLAEPISEENPQ
jgi:hypothetical protein